MEVCTLREIHDGDPPNPGGSSQLHGGKNRTRLASDTEMFVAAVRVGRARLPIEVGGGGLFDVSFAFSWESKSDLVVEAIDESAPSDRYLLANSEIGVIGESTTLYFSAKFAVASRSQGSRPIDHGSTIASLGSTAAA